MALKMEMMVKTKTNRNKKEQLIYKK